MSRMDVANLSDPQVYSRKENARGKDSHDVVTVNELSPNGEIEVPIVFRDRFYLV